MEKILLKQAFELDTGQELGQCRAVPVRLGKVRAFLALYGADFDVDPYVEMFFFPKDTLKMMVFNQEGQILWKRDLGKGVIPGVWFCPVLAFDLDGDGIDEIWFVNNENADHPLGTASYTLCGLNGLTGEKTAEIPWPKTAECRSMQLSQQFRNFIVGGYANGRPVLTAAQGTYGDMFFEGFGPGLELLWETHIRADEPGARGSHMCPVLDLNGDGTDELLWGERCLELAGGKELFCADRSSYRGHSDVIQPVFRAGRPWRLFTCREGDPGASPRLCCYDTEGNRIWGNLEQGHMDLGWTARLGENREHYAMGIRIGHKSCGPDGRYHDRYEEFVYKVEDGSEVDLGFSVYKSMPVDLNGDGYHEIVYGLPASTGDVRDRFGKLAGNVGGTVAMSGKLLSRGGEQLLVFTKDGKISIWYDANARDTEEARARYENPFYEKAMGVSGNGYNWCILGGI